MFLPHAIDMLNKRNFCAIQQLEAAAPHLRNLEQLCEQLGGGLRDVRHIDNNRFAFEISLPVHRYNNRAELGILLFDFGYSGCAPELNTGRLISMSIDGHRLVMTPIHRTAQAAA